MTKKHIKLLVEFDLEFDGNSKAKFADFEGELNVAKLDISKSLGEMVFLIQSEGNDFYLTPFNIKIKKTK